MTVEVPCLKTRSGAVELLLWGFIACASGDGCQSPECAEQSPPGGIADELTPDTLCSEVARVACIVMHECCSPLYSWPQTVGYLSSEADCNQLQEEECRSHYSAALAGMEKGTVELDTAVATECLQQLLHEGKPCVVHEKPEQFLPACRRGFFVGKVTSGKACLDDVECAIGLHCGADSKCAALPGVNEPCGAAAEGRCADGLACGVDGTCQPALLEGQECLLDESCDKGLFCVEDAKGQGRHCGPKGKTGAPCRSDAQCATAFCQPGRCVAWGGSKWQLGCMTDDDCQGGVCALSGGSCFVEESPCPGRCSEDGLPCKDSTGCADPQDSCVPEECVRKCAAGRYCAEYVETMDFCSAALDL